MILKPKVLGLITLIIMFGGISLSSFLGAWNTSADKSPSLLTTGEAAGRPDPADIRGSYTLLDISDAFGVPVIDLKTAFRLPDDMDAENFQVKGLETLFAAEAAEGKEIGVEAVRFFVAAYTGLPFSISEETYLPGEAVTILKQRGLLTPEQIQYLDTHTVGTVEETMPASPDASLTQAPVHTEPSSTDRTVTGTTTFQQLLDWGVSKTSIEGIIEGALPEPSLVIKDYFKEKGLEFSAYKQAIQDVVDASK